MADTRTVGSRDLAQELASLQQGDDFRDYMPSVQHWIRARLFDAAGVGAVEQNPRRGKTRQFPAEALAWTRLFAALAGRGVATADIEYLAGILHQRFPKAVDDALARRGDDVWLVYTSSLLPPNYAPGLPLTSVMTVQIQRGSVRLSYEEGAPASAFAVCVNLTRTFNP